MEINIEKAKLNFDLPQFETSIIKVIGVGGGGGNAVNYMYSQGIKGVEFIICNTDRQALDKSPIEKKIQIGNSLTQGRGVGGNPDLGMKAAMENVEDIRKALENNTKMLFITSGMGGGTGTGAAPVIAKLAKDMGILTIGIVTYPFNFEGPKRKDIAENGINELRNSVDALITIQNEKIKEMYNSQVVSKAFSHADDVLSTAAKGIAEIITITGIMNVDFEDVKAIMKDSGTAIMGSACAEGENRAQKVVEAALNSPLLKEKDINGAQHILLNISYGDIEVQIDELTVITDHIREQVGHDVDMKIGLCNDANLHNKVSLTIIATCLEGIKEPEFIIEIPQAEIEKPQNEIETPQNEIDEPQNEVETPQMEFEIPQKEIEFQPKVVEKKVHVLNEEKYESLEKASSHGQMAIPLVYGDNEEPYIVGTRSSEIENKLKGYSIDNMRSVQRMKELEDTPAFQRFGIRLDNTPHSSDVEVSMHVLSDDSEDKRPEIKEENAFLDGNVD
jgi:cell division protein FtsZ